jgi:hypothetical protein
MTLVVAKAEATCVWMISDTAITDPAVPLRQRRYLPKVQASHDRRALIAFAGNDAENAARIAALAGIEPAGPHGLDALISGSSSYPNTEFAYALFRGGKTCLYRIRGGASKELTTFHLGSTPAFDTFQRIRHGKMEPYAPKALKTFP